MDSTVERLMRLGFSEYEAKAYLALVQLGATTGYQVAKASGVPRSTIYEVLHKLVARGAALTQAFADQTRYAPIPPQQFLGRVRRDHEATLETLTAEFAAAAATGPPSGASWTLTGRANLFAYARQLIEEAKAEIALLAGDDDELDPLAPTLQAAVARHLQVLVISPTPHEASDLAVFVYAQGSRLRQAVGHGFTLVVDRRTALIGEVDRSESAVWTTNGYVVAWALWSLQMLSERNHDNH